MFRPEENGTVEGLWLMFKEGTYFLFYSASAFQLPTYRMMVARSDSLLGPYVKEHFSNIRNQTNNQRRTIKMVYLYIILQYAS